MNNRKNMKHENDIPAHTPVTRMIGSERQRSSKSTAKQEASILAYGKGDLAEFPVTF